MYSANDVTRLTGVQFGTLDAWDRRGFISPSVRAASGPGTDRLWSFRDLVAIRAAVVLRAMGVELASLGRIVRHLVENDCTREWIVDDGSSVHETDDATSVITRPTAVVINVKDIIATVSQ